MLNIIWFLVLTEWSDWEACRGLTGSSICIGPGRRRKTRSCLNACDGKLNLTATEDCEVTECPNALLVLSSSTQDNIPLLVDFDGESLSDRL